MTNTLLYSTKELSMLRINKQAQRQLDAQCQQIEQEKVYIGNDWNNRIRAFVSQKKKVMPKGWDHTKYRPPSVWSKTPRTVNDGELTGEYGAPVLQSTKIPRTWTLRASYIKYSDGRMVSTSLGKSNADIKAHKSIRATSAPGFRRHPLITARAPSFLVTQFEMEEELLNRDPDNNAFYNSSLTERNLRRYRPRPLSAANNNLMTVQSRPQSSRQLGQRPQSSTVTLKATHPYS